MFGVWEPGGREDVQQCLEYDCSGGGVRFQFLWLVWTLEHILLHFSRCVVKSSCAHSSEHTIMEDILHHPFHISICGTFKRCVDLTISWVTIMSKSGQNCAHRWDPFKSGTPLALVNVDVYCPTVCRCWVAIPQASILLVQSETKSYTPED